MQASLRASRFRKGGASAALALLCVGLQFSSLAHWTLVTHSTCAEHGELVHEGEAGHAAAPVQGFDAPSFRSSEASAEDHGHDHCTALSERRDQAVLAAQAHSIQAPASYTAITCEGRSAYVRTDLLLSAPKQSPPV